MKCLPLTTCLAVGLGSHSKGWYHSVSEETRPRCYCSHSNRRYHWELVTWKCRPNLLCHGKKVLPAGSYHSAFLVHCGGIDPWTFESPASRLRPLGDYLKFIYSRTEKFTDSLEFWKFL